MLSGDRSGNLRKIHDQLVALGLKTRMPSNSSTLLFEAVNRGRERIGLAALRDTNGGIFSFPRTYWGTRRADITTAVSDIDSTYFMPTEGSFSSSQYSAFQIRITGNTIDAIQRVITNLIGEHFNLIFNNR